MKGKFSFYEAIIIVSMLIGMIFYCLFILKVEPHLPLIACLIILSIVAAIKKIPFSHVQKAMINGISFGLMPILILALIGMLIAAWMASGTVPTLMYYGLQILSPTYFTISALFIAIIVSTFTGSSFTTIGTVGVALIGVANGLGVDPALAAGAIVSGACFGDKMSPLSDTTNFAPGIVGIDIFTHIRHMFYTTVPALTITIIFYLLLGKQAGDPEALKSLEEVSVVLEHYFHISIMTLLSPLVVVMMAMKRLPTLPTLVVGILTATFTAATVQGSMDGGKLIEILQYGYTLDSGNKIVDGIVNRGGLLNMMPSIALIMISLAFGGVLKELGIIDALIQQLTKHLEKRGHLIAATACSAIGVNLLTGEQYLSILLPGQTFKEYFVKAGYALKNLSRTLEDAGTLVNPLIPWGVSGVFFAKMLDVPVLDYSKYALFLTISPILTILFGYFGIAVPKTNEK